MGLGEYSEFFLIPVVYHHICMVYLQEGRGQVKTLQYPNRTIIKWEYREKEMGFRVRSGPNWVLDSALKRQVLDFLMNDCLMDFTFPWLLQWLCSDLSWLRSRERILMGPQGSRPPPALLWSEPRCIAAAAKERGVSLLDPWFSLGLNLWWVHSRHCVAFAPGLEGS